MNELERLQNRIKPQLLAHLDEWANTFKLIGDGNSESPRWAMLFVERRTSSLPRFWIGSSQYPTYGNHLSKGITLNSKDDENNVAECYDEIQIWWRELRTNHLAEHHPTIDNGYDVVFNKNK